MLSVGLVRSALAGSVGGFLAVSTDDLYHGLSETAGEPSLAAGFDYRTDRDVFAGLTAATVNLNPGPSAPVELGAFVGRAVEWGADWSGRVQLSHDEYPGDPSGVGYAYSEAVASLAWRELLTATLAYSPDATRFSTQGFNRHRAAAAVEGAGHWPFAGHWVLSAGLGYRQFAAPIATGYAYGSVGLSVTGGRWQADLGLVEASRRAQSLFGAGIAERRCVFTVSLRFADGVF
jgi:uncharacterized protein (TIGR02001 family)